MILRRKGAVLMLMQIKYENLNSRQRENYNFHKVAARLADYGYNCLRLSDDWQGADFIACHISGRDFLKVQLKGRLTIDKKYLDKSIHIAFPNNDQWYVYPHDEVVKKILNLGKVDATKSWNEYGSYTWPSIPKRISHLIDEYRV
jgi:hypothetical protein